MLIKNDELRNEFIITLPRQSTEESVSKSVENVCKNGENVSDSVKYVSDSDEYVSVPVKDVSDLVKDVSKSGEDVSKSGEDVSDIMGLLNEKKIVEETKSHDVRNISQISDINKVNNEGCQS